MNDPERYFHFKSLKIFLHSEVYEPAEDTFLMLDTIQIKSDQSVLEIGSGTGIISLFCAQQGAHVICTDINPCAIELINKNIKENKNGIDGTIKVRKGNLFDPIKSEENFDIIIFNPPYLPTTPDQKIGGWYDKSLNGGKTGLDVTIPFLKEVNNYVTPKGCVYFIFSSFSDKTLLENTIEKLSHKVSTINSLRCDDEILYVMKISY